MDILTVGTMIMWCIAVANKEANGQYLFRGGVKGGGSPVPSAPVADDTNPYVYNVDVNSSNDVILTKSALRENGVVRTDSNQQRVQSLPPNFVHTSKPPSSASRPYPPAIGPPDRADSSVLKTESFGDFFIFVPAFPSSSLAEEEGDLVGAAPAPGGTFNGFIPPDGALLGPPIPLVGGIPLPSPRISYLETNHRTRPKHSVQLPYQR